jgi:hypothetical protein
LEKKDASKDWGKDSDDYYASYNEYNQQPSTNYEKYKYDKYGNVDKSGDGYLRSMDKKDLYNDNANDNKIANGYK